MILHSDASHATSFTCACNAMFINTSNLNLHYHIRVIDGFYSMFRADVELYRSDAMLDFEEIEFELEE